MATKDLKDIIPIGDKLLEQTRQLIAALQGVNVEYEKVATQIIETSKKVEDSQKKASGKNKKEQEQLEANARAAEQLVRAQEKYKEALSENGQEIRKLRQTQRELQKQRDLERKFLESAEGSYDQLSAQYSLLKRQLNAMSQEQRKNTEEGRRMEAQAAEIYEEMNRLQIATGRYVHQIGNYEIAGRSLTERLEIMQKENKDLVADMRTLERQGLRNSEQFQELQNRSNELNQEIDNLNETIRRNNEENRSIIEGLSEQSGALGDAATGVQGLGQQFLKLLKNPVVAVLAAITGALIAVGKAFKSTRAGGIQISKTMTEISGRFEVARNNIGKTTAEVLTTEGGFKKLNKGIWAFTKGLITGDEKVKEATKSFKDQTNAVVELRKELIDLNDAYIEVEERLGISIVEQQRIADKQRAIADDATRGFLERSIAANKSRIASENAAKAGVELANERLKISEKEIQALTKAGAIDEQTGKALTVSAVEVKKAWVEARIEAEQAESEYSLIVLDNAKARAEIRSDELERDLDIQIDGFDNQKTINERLISDDKLTLAERFNALNRTKELFESTTNAQIDTIQTLTDKQLDFNDLVATDDAVLLAEKIRGYELSEIWEGRLLEAVRERRTATQDLAESEKDLLEAAFNERLEVFEQEQELNQLRLKNAGATEKEITKVSIQAEIERLEKELELAKIYGQEKTQVEVDIINEKIISLQKDLETQTSKKSIWDILGFTEEQGSKVIEGFKTIYDSITEIISTFTDQRIENADRAVDAATSEVESAENALDRQIELANQGYASNVQEAQRQLDLQKDVQAKAQEEQRRALREKQRLETVEQSVSLISASANVLKSFSAIPIIGWALGIAAVGAMLSAFLVQKAKAKKAAKTFRTGGYEEINTGGSHNNGNDTLIGHSNESELRAEKGESIGIFTANARKKYGKILPKFVENANKGKLLQEQYSNAFSIPELSATVIDNAGYDSNDMKDIKKLLTEIKDQNKEKEIQDKSGNRVIKKGNTTRILK